MGGGGGKSGDAVVGYWYSFTLHMGLGRGPLDSLVEIWVGDRRAWPKAGVQTVTNHVWVPEQYVDGGGCFMSYYVPGHWEDQQVTEFVGESLPMGHGGLTINAGDLFGGEEREGGIQGSGAMLMGSKDQAPFGPLQAMFAGSGVPVPAYRGVATFWYDGRLTAKNPYPKEWKFRVRRAVQGWDTGYGPFRPDLLIINYGGGADRNSVHAMNPAHIVYECATNRAWGRGLNPMFIDTQSFIDCATYLKNEGFGLSVRWNRTDELGTFVQSILDHVGAAVFTDRRTGRLRMRLIRQDYAAGDLPLFDMENGMLSVEEDSSASANGLINEVVVNWRSPFNGKKQQSRVQNIAAVQAMGGVFNVTKEYLGICEPSLALRAAQRDLKAEGMSLRRFKIKFDRRGWGINPGDVFRIEDPKRPPNVLIVRVGKIEDDLGDDGSIMVHCLQDVFGLPQTSFVEQQTVLDPGLPDGSTTSVQTAKGLELGYRDLCRKFGQATADALAETSGYATVFAKKPQPTALGITLFTKVGTGVFVNRGSHPFTPCGRLNSAITAGANTMTVLGMDNWSAVQVNTGCTIDNEICRVNSVDPSTGIVLISRGCADTIPAPHSANAPVWFHDAGYATDPTTYLLADDITCRPATNTISGVEDVSSAPSVPVDVDGRASKPYPPGNVQFAGDWFYNPRPNWNWSTDGAMNLTWSHRNRKTQVDVLTPHEMATITPEEGTSYTVRIVKAGNVVARTVPDLVGEAWEYTKAMWIEDGKPGTFTMELYSVRGGLNSHFRYQMIVGSGEPSFADGQTLTIALSLIGPP